MFTEMKKATKEHLGEIIKNIPKSFKLKQNELSLLILIPIGKTLSDILTPLKEAGLIQAFNNNPSCLQTLYSGTIRSLYIIYERGSLSMTIGVK